MPGCPEMILDRFTDAVLAQKGYSQHTARAYHSDILDFIRFSCQEDNGNEGHTENLKNPKNQGNPDDKLDSEEQVLQNIFSDPPCRYQKKMISGLTWRF